MHRLWQSARHDSDRGSGPCLQGRRRVDTSEASSAAPCDPREPISRSCDVFRSDALLALLAGLICLAPLAAQDAAPPDAARRAATGPRRSRRSTARHGMVVAQEARATRIGVDILQQGGNAVDAAVAIGFALAVTYPRAGNLGGGGFMVIHLADARRRHRDRLSRDRAGGDHARRLPRRQGRGRSAQVARLRRSRSACPARSPGSRSRMPSTAPGKFTLAAPDRAGDRAGARRHSGRGRPRGFAAARAGAPGALAVVGEDLPQADGRPLGAGRHAGAERSRRHARGDRARRPARLLRGPIAEKIVAAVRDAGGVMTRDDLKDYQADRARAGARHAIAATTSYRCRRPRPAACILIEMLNILEGFRDLRRRRRPPRCT